MDRTSPFPSPQQSTRSPLPKIQRRERTGVERGIQKHKPQRLQFQHTPDPIQNCVCSHHLKLIDFTSDAREKLEKFELDSEIHTYMIHRAAIYNSTNNNPFLGLQDYFSLTRPTHTEKSRVVYLEVMDAVADCKDTMIVLLHNLHETFIEHRNMKWVVLEGDAKLYDILKSLKFEYGEELNWLFPYPGDFHLLMNYQKALMKPYYDMGLKSMAQSSGYPLAAIQSCSQFKRTHHFILEVWESMYRVMLLKYAESNGSISLLHGLTSKLISMNTEKFLFEFQKHLAFNETRTDHLDGFRLFIQNMARTDETWRFWVQFVFEDAMAYVSLFLAIRSRNWDLRLASIKSMAAVFAAFDHPTYQRLISQHLEDVLVMPAPLRTMFRQGGFVMSISGTPWHSVAIDEGHEMLINKDCKSSIIHPLPDYINRITQHLPYRSKAIKNIQLQLFPSQQEKKPLFTTPFSTTPSQLKCEQNIQAQMHVIMEVGVLSIVDKNRGLKNMFTKKEANEAQTYDLLNFQIIGQREFLQRIAAVILKHRIERGDFRL